MLQIREVVAVALSPSIDHDLTTHAGAEFRQAGDGWHGVVPLGGARHRLWLQELPSKGALLAVELPLDADFGIRAHAARRFWLALKRRPLGTPVPALTLQRRKRLTLELRALDGWLQGNSYRAIAGGLFGQHRIAGRGWKTHDLRSRTIRLVQSGLTLMRGGYRALLRPRGRTRDRRR